MLECPDCGVRHALGLAFIGLEAALSTAVPDHWRTFFGEMPFPLQLGCVLFIAVFHRAFVTFTHVTTRLELRWFRWLIVTPRCHHHHHHHDRDAPPSNFAGLFPIFDVIFGTFHWPRALPEQYGVRHRVSERWLGQLLLPLVQTPAAREATSIKVFQNTKSPS